MHDYSLDTSVSCSCNEALVMIQRSLEFRGLRALQTFDLQDARLGDGECTCPYHGSSACDCQLLIFLVYGEALAPTTLMLHGNDGRTWISLMGDSLRPAEGPVAQAIEEAIEYIKTRQGL